MINPMSWFAFQWVKYKISIDRPRSRASCKIFVFKWDPGKTRFNFWSPAGLSMSRTLRSVAFRYSFPVKVICNAYKYIYVCARVCIKDGQRDGTSFHCNELDVKHRFGGWPCAEGMVSGTRVCVVLSMKWSVESRSRPHSLMTQEIMLPHPFL